MVGFILLSRFTTICVDEVPAPRSHLTTYHHLSSLTTHRDPTGARLGPRLMRCLLKSSCWRTVQRTQRAQ